MKPSTSRSKSKKEAKEARRPESAPTMFRCSISKVRARDLVWPGKKGPQREPAAYFRFHFFNVKPFQTKVAKPSANPSYKFEHEWLYRTLMPKKLATRKLTIEYKASSGGLGGGVHVGVAVIDLLALATGPVARELELFSVADASVSVGWLQFELVMEEFGFPLMSMELAVQPRSASAPPLPPSFFCQLTQLPLEAAKLKGQPRHRSPTLAKLRAPFFVLDNVPFDNASYKGLLHARLHLQLLSKDHKARRHPLHGAFAVLPLADVLSLKKNETVDAQFELHLATAAKDRAGAGGAAPGAVAVAEVRAKVNWLYLPRMVQMLGGVYNSRTGITGGRVVANAVAPRLRGYEVPVHRAEPPSHPGAQSGQRSKALAPSASAMYAAADVAEEQLSDSDEREAEGDERNAKWQIDAQQLPPLPEHWMRAYDERGNVYYIDTVTKRHQWTHPLMGTLGSQRALTSLRRAESSSSYSHASSAGGPYPPVAPHPAPTLRQLAHSTSQPQQPQQQQQQPAPARPTLEQTGRQSSGFFAHFKPEAPPPELISNEVEAEGEDDDEDDDGAATSSVAVALSTDEEPLELEDDEDDSGSASGSSGSGSGSSSSAHDAKVAAALALLSDDVPSSPAPAPVPVSAPVPMPTRIPAPPAALAAAPSALPFGVPKLPVAACFGADGPFTVLLVGWSGVGRSALLQRLLLGTHLDTRYGGEMEERSPVLHVECAALGVELPLLVRNPRVTPDRRFDELSELERVHAVALVYDITDKDSFESLVAWWKATRRADVPALLIGNHLDERDDREVAARKVSMWSRANDVPSLECSVKTGENFGAVVDALLRLLVQSQRAYMRQQGLDVPPAPIDEPLALNASHGHASSTSASESDGAYTIGRASSLGGAYDTGTVVVRDGPSTPLPAAATADAPLAHAGSAQRLRDLFTPPPPRSAEGAAVAASAHPALAQAVEHAQSESQSQPYQQRSSSARATPAATGARPKPELNPYSPQQLDRVRQ